jgi:hypothetical protein
MHNYRKLILVGLLLSAAVLLAACGKATPAPTAEPTQAPAPTAIVPQQEAAAGSGHADVTAEAFRHWDGSDPAEVPTSCAKCHTAKGYMDYLGADGSAAGKVDAAVPAAEAQGITCVACHNAAATTHTSVVFPGKDAEGNPIVIENLGPSARCMECHQGREAKASVDKQIADFGVTDLDAVVAPMKDASGKDVAFGFRNIHYFAAAATLLGTDAKGGYEYEGKVYDARFRHVEGYDSCVGCHDAHSLQVKVTECAQCHEGVTSVDDLKKVRMVSSAKDYDGDGNTTEGIYDEITGLQDLLYAQIRTYAKAKTGTAIAYSPAAYPYWFADTNGDGKAGEDEAVAANGFKTWTARLLKAAYNYQLSVKDPGKFVHGGKYTIELLFDSIDDLGGDVSKLARSDAGHFAGDSMPFRDWDDSGVVPFGCVKCHTSGGLPQFIKNGGTVTFDSRGTVYTTGVASMPPSNGFMCSTCHDESNWPNLYAVTTVPFPSGASITFSKPDADGKLQPVKANLCLECHQGRESTGSVNAALKGKDLDTVDSKIGFKNVHYFAAGATLFGGDAKGAYLYDGKTYIGAHPHVAAGFDCSTCHNVHALEVKTESCVGCHPGTKDITTIRMGGADFDGDGNTTEGIRGEVETMADALYAQIKVYAADKGTGILYDPGAYPYFFVDKDNDGKPDVDDKGATIRYNAFTPRLMKAAYNLQYAKKDTGAWAHNGRFVIQFLIDSIEDLGGDVSKYTRP